MASGRLLRLSTIVLTVLLCSLFLVSLSACVYAEPSVGVKDGDWIEYSVNINGTGSPPPTHDVTWFRITVLQVDGAAFSADFTVRYSNGTMGSEVWDFNFTEGDVRGWVIIPSGLGPGDSFYDYSAHTGVPVNVTIQSEAQKMVLGAARTVTYGVDAFRHKTWDKATGVFIYAVERYKNVTNRYGWYIEDLTVTVQATATNMWSSQILGLNQTAFYWLVGAVVLALLIWLSTVAFSRMKQVRELSLSASVQKKLVIFTVVVTVLAEAAAMAFLPFYEFGLSVSEFNLMLQTFWFIIVLMSLWWRMKGNYFIHELTMLIVICETLLGFSVVLLLDPMSASSMVTLASTTVRMVMNILHAVFSIPALVFGTWLVLLWRPESATYPARSRRIAQFTVVFWLLSYVVGVLDFLMLHTPIFS